MAEITQLRDGEWRRAIPQMFPWFVRWTCRHEWTPADPMIEWGCVRCGERRDGMPKDGPYPVRRWLGLRLFKHGRAERRGERMLERQLGGQG